MGLFGNIKDAKSTFHARYIQPGEYWLKINRTKVATTRNGEDFVAIETTVIKVIDDVEEKSNRLGEDCSQLIMAKHTDTFLGNVKAFIASAFGMPPDEVTEEVVNAVMAEEGDGAQPLAGTVMHVKARNTITKKGGDFTVINWLGEIPAAELLESLSEESQARFFGNTLAARAEQEAQAEKVAAQG